MPACPPTTGTSTSVGSIPKTSACIQDIPQFNTTSTLSYLHMSRCYGKTSNLNDDTTLKAIEMDIFSCDGFSMQVLIIILQTRGLSVSTCNT